MSAAFVISASAGSSDGNAVTTSGVDTTGADLLVAIVSDYLAATASVLTDSKGNTWSALPTEVDGASVSRLRVFYCRPATVGAGHTFTLTGTGSFPSVAVLAFSSSPGGIDKQDGSAGASVTTKQAGSITPSADNEIVIAAAAGYTTGITNGIDSGFTLQESVAVVGGQHLNVNAAYLLQGAAAAVNPTWDAGSGRAEIVAIIASFGAASNPVPTLTSISPTSTPNGSPNTAVAIVGTNFVNGVSSVQLDGVAQPAVFVDSSHMTATFQAAYLAGPRTALVTVVNSAPGGGTSGSRNFTITPSPPDHRGGISPTLLSLAIAQRMDDEDAYAASKRRK